ncbi:hypothetical protein IU449_26740 [Nocardia higoensis]|uniref:Uncharacterized protein n=1 Tax=Nocardia higoensis TaxID=228599 RepID=A0ABS0DKL2_9NOCA|nr:hypothetical protein [Nocardia higoensis]MBF6358097.1 hypothetical protein [Nocardia higoensis]
MTTAEPHPCPADIIVGVVECYARQFPHLKPPMFRFADVAPMLAGSDREYEAACVLFDHERVHYMPGEEL